MATPDFDTASLEDIASALRNGDPTAATLADWAIANHERRGEAVVLALRQTRGSNVRADPMLGRLVVTTALLPATVRYRDFRTSGAPATTAAW